MPSSLSMKPRVEELRDDLANRMPVKRSTDLTSLLSKHVTDVMIQYLTWQARLIRPRPRSVVIWPEVTSSPHYPMYKSAIERISVEFEAGRDMNSALSNQVRSNVYAGDLPTKTSAMTQDEWVKKAWKGKDRIRVLVDVHHLHMGARRADGSVGRTGELLFVGVIADKVFFLAIGDHDSFTDGSITKLMHDKLEADLVSAGGGVLLPPGLGVTLGGTQIKDTLSAIKIVKQLETLDEELDAKGAGIDHIIRMDWDDIVVFDASRSEIARIPGRL